MQAVPRLIAELRFAALAVLFSAALTNSAHAWVAVSEPGVELKAVVTTSRSVAVAGRQLDTAGNSALYVAQYSQGGTLMWRATEPAGAGEALAAAADARGDLYVSGADAAGNFAVAKYSATSGKRLWSTPVSSGEGLGEALALDRTGHVVAAGYASLDDGAHGIVAQLDAATGKPRWSWSPLPGELRAVALDSKGDVFAAGRLLAVKLASATGDELWRLDRSPTAPAELGGPQIRSVAVDRSGNVVVGGALRNSLEDTRAYYTAALNGASGAILWESIGPATDTLEGAVKVGLDASGAVYSTGRYEALPAVQRLDRSGKLQWTRNPWAADSRADNALAVNDLAFDTKAVYAAGSEGSGRFLLASLNRTGTPRWQRDLGAGKAVAEALCSNGRLFTVGQLSAGDGTLPRAVLVGFTASTGAPLPTGKK